MHLQSHLSPSRVDASPAQTVMLQGLDPGRDAVSMKRILPDRIIEMQCHVPNIPRLVKDRVARAQLNVKLVGVASLCGQII